MKKSILFVTAVATAIGFAACNGGGEGTLTKEQADSIANAKADSMANALKAQNDSLIAAQAAAEARRVDSARIADSLFAAGKKSGTIVSKPSKPSKPSTPSEGPAPAPKPEENNKGTVTDRKSTKEQDAARKVTDRKSTQEQDATRKVTDRKSKQKVE